MTASGIKLVDANVWLALSAGSHVHHTAARDWFDGQLDGACAFCRVTQLALLRHLTNAKIMGPLVQNQQQAWDAYDCLINDPRVIFLTEPPGLDIKFRALSSSTNSSSKLWTDAYLAALAIQTFAQLVTFDRGFQTFAGLDLGLLG